GAMLSLAVPAFLAASKGSPARSATHRVAQSYTGNASGYSKTRGEVLALSTIFSVRMVLAEKATLALTSRSTGRSLGGQPCWRSTSACHFARSDHAFTVAESQTGIRQHIHLQFY